MTFKRLRNPDMVNGKADALAIEIVQFINSQEDYDGPTLERALRILGYVPLENRNERYTEDSRDNARESSEDKHIK